MHERGDDFGREIARALNSFPSAPGAALTDRIMARVAVTPQAALAPQAGPVLDWWVRAAAEPSVSLAGLLAALMLWNPAALVRLGGSLLQSVLTTLANAADRLSPPAPPAWLTAPTMTLALTMAALPAILWLSYSLYRWSERRFVPAAGGSSGPLSH